jgi:hypothetical protein
MQAIWKDLGRGMLYALPVMAVAGLGAHEVIRLQVALDQSEARWRTAERARIHAEAQWAVVLRQNEEAVEARRRAEAEAAAAHRATEERLTRVVEFLKAEVTTAESTIEALRQGAGGAGAEAGGARSPGASGTALLREISRLNAEIEALRATKPRDP